MIYYIEENSLFYCKECNKIYNNCYELEKVYMCYHCWSLDIQVIPDNQIQRFIRNKRLKRIKEFSENEKIERG